MNILSSMAYLIRQIFSYSATETEQKIEQKKDRSDALDTSAGLFNILIETNYALQAQRHYYLIKISLIKSRLH